jgi:multidrug efflux system membrane fusion protein
MAKDQALLKNAQVDLERYQLLNQQDSISKQQLDTQAALVREDEAALKVDQGRIDSARLQLAYSRITAPISGRVGLRLVDPGNIVHASGPQAWSYVPGTCKASDRYDFTSLDRRAQ